MIEMAEKNEISEYSQVEAGLQELRRKYGGIAIDVGTTKALDEAKRVRAAIREPRYECEKIRKALKAPALAYAKLIDTEAARITSALMEIETPWDEAIKSEERRREVEKEAELQKERDRIAAHQAVITQIKSYPMLAATARTSEMMLQLLQKLHNIDISGLEEFLEQARSAMMAADESLNDLIDTKKAEEAEAARIKAEQEEAARVLAEQQAELIAQQARMKAQQEELDRRAAEMAQQAAELAARKQEEANRLQPVITQAEVAALAADPREALAQVMAGTPQPVEQEPALIQQPATVDEMHTIGNGIMYGNDPEFPPTPAAMDLVHTIAYAQGVSASVAVSWLADRSDEFNHLKGFTADYLNQIKKVTP